MRNTPGIGYLHHSDGTISVVGPDGFCHDDIRDLAELADDETPALDVPTIDVAPESVTDREIGQREIGN